MIVISLMLVSLGLVMGDRTSLPPTCDSLIYCHGPLLDTVQMASLYKDSKTFVDMKLKLSPNITLEHFRQMMSRVDNRPTKADIQEFVDDNFDPEGSEFEDWRPTDWKDNPAFLQRIKDSKFRQWASDLNDLWLKLGRKMTPDVKQNPDLYSIIYVENPVIVPGGRFREFYYWDSYWIIKGLLLSEMRTTAHGMVSNLLSIVDRFGFIPNGGRIYYLMRSQPPLLIPMVKLLMDDSNDLGFLGQHIHTLDREYDFWLTNHTVVVEHNGQQYKMARYNDMSQGPRPESYKEDVDCAQHFETREKKEELYAELKAAAESGWDFSSRWFILNGTNKGNLTNLKTRSIVPVDLNAIMCWNAGLMADFHRRLGNNAKADYYREVHDHFMEAIEKVLWHEDVGVWLDYSLDSSRRRDYFYPSNTAPLWAESYDKARQDYFVNRVINYLDNVKVDIYDGGIPSTLEHTGEQWDYPNAWPPMQYIFMMGLANTEHAGAKRLAYELSTKWVRSNFEVWRQSSSMLEKYDATIFGGFGGGGEYVVQTGFGWSNGVIMVLLNKYGDRMFVADSFGEEGSSGGSEGRGGAVYGAHVGAGGVATAVLVIVASLAAGTLGFFFGAIKVFEAQLKVMVYRKRRDYAPLISAEDLKRLARRPYTELRSMNGPSNPRQRNCYTSGSGNSNIYKKEHIVKGLLVHDNVPDTHWEEYKAAYNKIYYNIFHEVSSLKAWKYNLKRVAKHNKEYLAGKRSYSLHLNHFGDWPIISYFKQLLKLIKTIPLFDPAEDHGKTAYHKNIDRKVPERVDWREEGFKPRLEEQYHCGACYAFAVAHAVQAQLYKKHGDWRELSPQQIVDCSFKDGNLGCDGGSLQAALRYAARDGLIMETYYPYIGKKGLCHYSSLLVATRARRWATLPSGDEDAMELSLATIGPLAVAVNAAPFTFQLYRSGIYDDPFCVPWNLNHAMLLVGYTSDYWILLNWWGKQWGENGYMRIRRGLNICGVANMATYVEL